MKLAEASAGNAPRHVVACELRHDESNERVELRRPDRCSAESAQDRQRTASVHLDQPNCISRVEAPRRIATLPVSGRKTQNRVALPAVPQRAREFDGWNSERPAIDDLQQRQIVLNAYATNLKHLRGHCWLSAHPYKTDIHPHANCSLGAPL